MAVINFYYEYEENGFLSNFYPSPIYLDGYMWPTVEHFYQASKTDDQEYRDRVRLAPTADEAKKLGNDPACAIRDDWDVRKVNVMRQALIAKFSQHSELRSALLATGDAILVENSKKDYFWGIGAEGTGKSMLGALLMELRASIIAGES